jgi:hypothetical protein
MDHYLIWVDLAPGVKDLDFVAAVDTYLGHLKSRGMIEHYVLLRRKFGFSPAGLGEFHLDIQTKNLTQLDEAFNVVATRAADIEALHAPVFQKVVNFKSALYRDFPDPVRVKN